MRIDVCQGSEMFRLIYRRVERPTKSSSESWVGAAGCGDPLQPAAWLAVPAASAGAGWPVVDCNCDWAPVRAPTMVAATGVGRLVSVVQEGGGEAAGGESAGGAKSEGRGGSESNPLKLETELEGGTTSVLAS